MEINKIPFEKLFGFVAGIIPGSAALYVYYIANPVAFHPFLATNVFGYSTKVSIALGLSFVIGNSLTTFANAFGGAVGGAFGGIRALKAPVWPSVSDTAPWRDPKWRKLAAQYLGEHAPNDTYPMTDSVFQAESEALIYLPETERSEAFLKLFNSRVSLATDDSDWKQWYLQIDRQRRAQERPDTSDYIQGGLRSNLEVTALYLMASMIFVPITRNWICICFSSFWAIVMVAEIYVALRDATDPWSTWSEQMVFLAHETHNSQRGMERADN
jgi:hypothetical protein